MMRLGIAAFLFMASVPGLVKSADRYAIELECHVFDGPLPKAAQKTLDLETTDRPEDAARLTILALKNHCKELTVAKLTVDLISGRRTGQRCESLNLLLESRVECKGPDDVSGSFALSFGAAFTDGKDSIACTAYNAKSSLKTDSTLALASAETKVLKMILTSRLRNVEETTIELPLNFSNQFFNERHILPIKGNITMR